MSYMAGDPVNISNATLAWVQPLQGASFIPCPHTPGLAWPMQRGVFLQLDDYTEDSTGFYLTTITADGVEKFGILILNAVNIVNALTQASPRIVSGGLTFPDGTVINTAPQSNRNYFVDPGFEGWTAQGAAVPQSPQYPGPMMYRVGCGANGAATINYAGTAGSNLGPGFDTRMKYYANFVQTTPSTGGSVGAFSVPMLYQNIEDVTSLQGQSGTFSCWLSATAPMTITQVLLAQYFGIGTNSPSASVITAVPVNWNLTTVPTRFSVRLDFPNIAGKTVGNQQNGAIQVGVIFPSGATFNVYTTGWQLEKSSPLAPAAGIPTDLEYRGAGPEMARWRRYFAVDKFGFIGNAQGASAYVGNFYSFDVPMRINPAINITGATESSNVPATPSITVYNGRTLRIWAQANAQGQVVYSADFTADARI